MNVDFPQPEGPTMTTNSPGAMANVRPSTAKSLCPS
jgi:hypothetical protein